MRHHFFFVYSVSFVFNFLPDKMEKSQLLV